MELGWYREQNFSRVAETRKMGGKVVWINQGVAVMGLGAQPPPLL